MIPYTKKDDAVELRINWESKWKKLIDAIAGYPCSQKIG